MNVGKGYCCLITTVILLITISSNFILNRFYVHASKLETKSHPDPVGDSSERAVTVSLTSDDDQLNPGCIYKKFDLYKPVDTGINYYHPPVIHYVKLSTEEDPVRLSFLDYMSVMSAYKFLKPERILFHTYTDIEGRYWSLVKKFKHTSAGVNKVEQVTHLGGKEVTSLVHQADFLKLQGLLKFGGVVSDLDVIVLNGTRVRRMQRISECVLSKGGKSGNILNAGFASCMRNSLFVRQWLDGYHQDYRPELYAYNSAFKPLSILEDSTSDVCYNVHLDDTISLNPSATQAEKWKEHHGVQWRGKTAARHFTKIANQTLLQDHNDNSLADMLRYVFNA